MDPKRPRDRIVQRGSLVVAGNHCRGSLREPNVLVALVALHRGGVRRNAPLEPSHHHPRVGANVLPLHNEATRVRSPVPSMVSEIGNYNSWISLHSQSTSLTRPNARPSIVTFRFLPLTKAEHSAFQFSPLPWGS